MLFGCNRDFSRVIFELFKVSQQNSAFHSLTINAFSADRIIRTEESFQRISEYIRNNPANWQPINFINDYFGGGDGSKQRLMPVITVNVPVFRPKWQEN